MVIKRSFRAFLLLLIAIPFYTASGNLLEQAEVFDSARHFNNLGIDSYRRGDFEKAEYLFKRSLRIKRAEQGNLSPDLANTYTNLGAVNRRLFNLDDAMLYYDSAGYIFMHHHGPDHLRLGAVYQNQGNLLREQREINSALTYYRNALRIFVENNRLDWAATLYNNMGIANWMAGNFESAKDFYNRSMKIREGLNPFEAAIPAGNLAICYRETGDFQNADKYYRLSIDAISGSSDAEHPNLATNLMNYGLFLIVDGGEPDAGYELLLKALQIFRINYGESGYQIARTYMNIGHYYELSGEIKTALNYYQRSLVSNSETFDSYDPARNPDPDDHVFSPDYMLSTLKHKARALYLLFVETNEPGHLKTSLETYRIAIEYIDRIRMAHHTEESRILLSENEHEAFMEAILVSWELYNSSGDYRYLDEGFNFSERSKSASLLASLRDFEARSFGGVPAELLEEETSLKRRIAAYRAMIYEEQRLVDPDNVMISMWQERVFLLELELRHLIGRLEAEYPDYYALKYNLDVISAGETQQIAGPRDALVKYVYFDSLIYIFTVTSNNTNFYRVKTPVGFEGDIETLLAVLTGGNLDNRVNEDHRAFTIAAHRLYKVLIAPVMSDIRNRRLVIVPDGILSYIPFELLLTSNAGFEAGNYKNLPYLLRDFPVSYNYSATLWKQSLSKQISRGGRALAMAPDYRFAEMPGDTGLVYRQQYRNMLVPLPGAREEAIEVAGILKGDLLLDDEATESRFKDIAGNYRVLHFAMHTLIDDENPMYSKLVFSDQDDLIDDGFLNTHEIYNLNLNAGLAVLSSCRSGYGNLRRGEGIMSLARGFLYAGVPSIVMTNWEVEDKSGAEIMIGFYRYLLRGYRKDEALRMARLDFLDNADMLRAHPYFWGAYVCIGNPDEMFGSYRHFIPVLTFVLLLMVMLGIVWKVGFKRSS